MSSSESYMILTSLLSSSAQLVFYIRLRTPYADDIFSISAQCEGLQLKADTVSATSRQDSAETIFTVMVISPFRQATFPSKYCPWSLNALYKHHLYLLPANSSVALYMPPDTGGLPLSRLSDRILMDKWAMMWGGLHSDLSTYISTEGLHSD